MRHHLLFILVSLPSPAFAQALSCAIPDRIPQPRVEMPRPAEVRQVAHDGYILALSWSPQFCKSRQNDGEHAVQCDGRNRFGFILHGLWPDAPGRNDPAYCAAAAPVPAPVIKANLCMMPSVNLIQHEWAKHGTCMSPKPEIYYRAASTLYRAVRFPDMTALSMSRPSIAEFANAFAAMNPGMSSNMMSVQTNEGGWLKEVRICLNKNMQLKPCDDGERNNSGKRALKIWRDAR